jgi:cobalt-zinc-cadmium efflux system membrane fusion protein
MRIVQIIRAAFSMVPALAVLGLLGVLGVVGHRTDWKLSKVPELWKGRIERNPESRISPESAAEDPAPAPGIRFPSHEALDKSGIRTAEVSRRPLRQLVTANGTVDYNRTRLAHIASRVPGIVWKIYKQVGESAGKDEVLAVVEAAEVGRAKSEFLLALRSLQLKTENLQRLKQADHSGAVPERQLREAESLAAEAGIRRYTAEQALVNLGLPIHAEGLSGLSDEALTRRIQFLGLPDAVARELDPAITTANLIPLCAPFTGLVIRCDLAVGEVVNSAQALCTVADIDKLWVTLDVPQEVIGLVRIGQLVSFRPDGATEAPATGQLAWISTEVDDRTRTVRVRAEVENKDRQLRARSFGTGQIVIAEKPDAVVVPLEAVQRNGAGWILFVCAEDGLSFEPRTVEVGLRDREYAEIVKGVSPGDIVATLGSHVLRSELFRSEIHGGD